MVGKVVTVEGLEGLAPDQALDERSGHPIMEALTDHRERQGIQFAVVDPRAELSEDGLEPIEARTDRFREQDVERFGGDLASLAASTVAASHPARGRPVPASESDR